MKTHIFLSLLLSWLTVASSFAEDALSMLQVNLADGSNVQFLLPAQNPTFRCYKGVMSVYYYDNTDMEMLTFGRDEVTNIVIRPVDTAVPQVKGQEPSLSFAITRPGVVTVSGLKQGDRLQAYTLDGKSVSIKTSLQDGSAVVDLSSEPCGVYMVSVNKSFTFKLMKP